eukprot:1471344-Pyramimonas_sp.AAC.1
MPAVCSQCDELSWTHMASSRRWRRKPPRVHSSGFQGPSLRLSAAAWKVCCAGRIIMALRPPLTS